MNADQLLDSWGKEQVFKAPNGASPSLSADQLLDDWDAENGGFLSGIKDVAVSGVAAIPSMAQSVVDVARMATGDPQVLKDTSQFIEGLNNDFKNWALSEATLAQKRRIDRAMSDPNFEWSSMPSLMVSNPRAMANMGVESFGSMLIPAGAGAAAVKGVTLANDLSKLGKAGSAAKYFANMDKTKAALMGANAGNMAMNAADTYTSDELADKDQSDRYLGAAISAGASLLANKLTGGAAESALARAFSGLKSKATQDSLLKYVAKEGVKGLLKEGAQESGEELGNLSGEHIGAGTPFNFNQDAKRTALAGTLGALMGGPVSTASSFSGYNPNPQQVQATNQVATTQDPNAALEAIQKLGTEQQPIASKVVVEQSQTPKAVEQKIAPTPEGEPTTYVPLEQQTNVETQTEKRPVLQNRQRSNKASIEQMQSIAGNPDYGRVSIGRDFANGAPVVAYGSVPDTQKGRADYATTVNGDRIPVQYAVVEADTVKTSHNASGVKNEDYGNTDQVTAIAGNGRIAGIAAAYQKGTATNYRKELTEDAAMHGIDPQVINSMKNPVLVRIMPNENVTDNIGDISNTASNQQLNAVEMAHNDANRVNFESMEFNEDGAPTTESVVDFIRSMPSSERGGLIDDKGRITSQAVDRLNQAIFAKAYGNDDVIAMYAQAVDPEAKLVINALSSLAPKMAKLDGCGELDFRGALIDAVNQIVQGKRKGLKMEDIVKQIDAFTDPDVYLFMNLFAQNTRSNKQVIEVLSDAADFAYNEATRDTETEDMFGGAPKATRADLMQHIEQTNNEITEFKNAQRLSKKGKDTNVQNPTRGVGAVQDASGGNTGANPSTNDQSGLGNAQGDESFSLQGQTEEELEAEAQAQEEAELARQRQEAEDQKARESADLKKEVGSLNDQYADNFALEDDSVSSEDALRGQEGLKFSRNPNTGKPDIKLSVAWHGSPHVFDTFLTDHIGSGEGAQAHGWGLYFTKNREVAEGYRNALAGSEIIYKGKDINHLYRKLEDSGQFGKLAIIEQFMIDQSLPTLRKDAPNYIEDGAFSKEEWDWFEKEVVPYIKQEGRVFEVEIPQNSKFLEENAPIYEQSKTVQKGIINALNELQEQGKDVEYARDNIFKFNQGYIYYILSSVVGNDKETSILLNKHGIKGISYDGASDGRCYVVFDDQSIKVLNFYSKNKGQIQSGETVESITEHLENDPEIGEAFSSLVKREAVVVVQSVDQIPGFALASKSPMKSVEANIKRGNEAMAKALAEKTTVHRAMFRTGMGWVDFVWGDEGGELTQNGRRPGGKGIAHIIEARKRKDGLNEKQVDSLLSKIVETIATGKEIKRVEVNGTYSVIVTKGNVQATLVKNPGNNTWLLTGFEIRESDDNRVGYDSPTSTSGAPHLPDAREVADSLPPRIGERVPYLSNGKTAGLGKRPSMDVNSSVEPNSLIVKRSSDGSIQGAYDPQTQKAYLVADNLSKENARSVFMHEVGVHMAADGDMKPIFARAKQIVWNGSANGDKIAMAARKRMDDAKETSPEEAAAYLVEEAVKAGMDISNDHPIARWMKDLVRRIKLWVNKKLGSDIPGFRLSTEDIVAVAKANAKSLGKVERKPSNGQTIFKDDFKGEWREPGKYTHTEGGKRGTWARNLGRDSGWGKPIQRDELGDREFAWGRHLVTGMGNIAMDVAEAMIPAMRTKYALRLPSKEVRQMYRELRAGVDNARRQAGEVAKEISKWSDNDRRMISDVIEGLMKEGSKPPEHVAKMANIMSNLMTQQGQDLVDADMLSEESFNRWRGKYLPRFYHNRKEMAGEGWFKKFMANGAPIRGVAGGSLKGRGNFQLIEYKDLDKYLEMGFEVRDERFAFKNEAKDSQPELAFKDFPNKEIRGNEVLTVWRDWTPEERHNMGEIRDAGYRFVMGYMQMQEDLALGRLFKQVAQRSDWVRNTPSEGYSLVPDVTIPETGGVKKYGALSGKYVKDEVLAQIMPHAEIPSAFARAYRNLLSYWKEGKTALNPVSHMNNTMGNVIMAHFAGVNMWDARSYWAICTAFKNNEAWIEEAKKNGLFTGSFSKEEIAKLLPEEYSELAKKQESKTKQCADLVFNYLLNYGLRNKMRNLYEAEDVFFKALIYKSALDKGMSSKDAVDYALKFIPSYDDLPGGARFIRDTTIPFFAWTYKVIPTILTQAAAHPFRAIVPTALMWSINMLGYCMAAGDDDDSFFERVEKGLKLQEAERGLLPEYMQGMGLLLNPKSIRLWIDPTTNLPVYWNVSNFIPGGQLFDFTNQSGGMAWPEMLTIGSPLYTAWVAMNLNTDTFTGREITKKSDTVGEATEKRASYMWRQMAPALAVGGYHFERVANALANATGEAIGPYTGVGRNGQAVTPLSAAVNTIGIKVRDVDFDKEFQFDISDIQAENREIKANIRSLSRHIKQGSVNPLEAQEEIEDQRMKIKENAKRIQELNRLNTQRKTFSTNKGE